MPSFHTPHTRHLNMYIDVYVYINVSKSHNQKAFAIFLPYFIFYSIYGDADCVWGASPVYLCIYIYFLSASQNYWEQFERLLCEHLAKLGKHWRKFVLAFGNRKNNNSKRPKVAKLVARHADNSMTKSIFKINYLRIDLIA